MDFAHIAIVLGLLVLGVGLFWRETFSVDVTTLILVLALIFTGVLKPEQAFAGFSSDIIIILASVFVLSGALQRTGLVELIASQMLKVAGRSQSLMLFLMMAVVGLFSAFMNNTTVTALFLPPVMAVAKQIKVSPSRLLMPLAFASILGGTCTLIGTSTNVAVSGYLKNAGLEPIGLFEITPVGLMLVGAGIVYMMTVGRRFLPEYPDESLTQDYEIREYLSEIVVLKDSHMIGQKIYESDLAKLDFQILAVIRGKKKIMPHREMVVEPSDILLVKGKVEELMKVKKTAGIEIKPELKLDDPALQSDDIKIAEALIPPHSDLIGRTLKDINFRQRFGLTVLALYRRGHPLREKIKNVHLRLGDLILVQGTPERVENLRRSHHLSILEELRPTLRKQKGILTVGLFAAAVAISVFGWVPISSAFLAAAVGTIVARCIRPEECYEVIDWRLLILIGGMTAFGKAMEQTGAAEWLANGIVNIFEPLGPHGIMAGFFILTIFLTQPMSNAAAALVVLPIALNTATQLGVEPRSFAMAVLFAASVSLVTPLEPSCVLVYGPGKYRFSDFVKTGLVLTIILMVIIFFMVPAFWPFSGTK
jgi:di/tricarboxylate transporter